MKNKRIGLITGGWSVDVPHGIAGSNDINKALSERGYNVIQFEMDYSRISRQIKDANVDIIIDQTVGKYGEDGIFQYYLEKLKIPYTGSGPSTTLIAGDKLIWKQLVEDAGIPTAPFTMFHKLESDQEAKEKILNRVGLPVIMKPAGGGQGICSIGICVALKEEDLDYCITESRKYCTNTLVERYYHRNIGAKEIDVSIIEDDGKIISLPLAEYVAHTDDLFFKTKYKVQSKEESAKHHSWKIPADISKEMDSQIHSTAEKIFKLLNMRGFGRIDFMVTENSFYPTDVTINPEVSMLTQFGKSLACAGISYADFSEILIRNAGLNKI